MCGCAARIDRTKLIWKVGGKNDLRWHVVRLPFLAKDNTSTFTDDDDLIMMVIIIIIIMLVIIVLVRNWILFIYKLG